MDATKQHLRSLLDKPGRANAPPPTNVVPIESDDDYTAYAHGRISRHPQLTLAFRLADGTARGFAYSWFYGVEATEPDRCFTLDFTHHKVKVEGRNLENLFRLICQHRVAEVRQADRSQSFQVAADAPIVQSVEIQAT
jgi:hypothetical protein